MANNVNIKATITAEDKASDVISGVGLSFGKLTAGVAAGQLAFKAATFVWDKFTDAISGSLKAFESQELATTRLQAGINNVKSATDKHIDSLINQAKALQKTTRFSDEAIESAQGILSTFQLNQTAITKLTPRLIDMSEGLARVTGEMPDLESNAILVAKALGGEDTTGMVGALRRVGVIMTDAQQTMLKTGNQEQRLSLITQILDQNFKGMGESAGNTTAGKIAILKNNFNDLQEKAGELMATALNPLLNVLNQHPALLEATTVAVMGLVTAFIALKVAASISFIVSGLGTAITAVGTAATGATTALATLTAVSIAGWAALVVGDFLLVKNAANAVKGAFDAVYNAQQAVNNLGNDAQVRDLQKQATAARALGDTKKVNQIANAIAALSGGRAGGGEVYPGSAYRVGEAGPEVFMPQERGKIIPANQLNSNSTINVSFNGIFTGNQQEFRKLAVDVFKAYDDAKGMGTI